MAHWLVRLLRHRLLDEADARRALGPDGPSRIEQRVAASEARHTGQIRVCVEAGLPLAHLRGGSTPRQRAIEMFGQLGVDATEHRNGVLVYLLLAERAIEIVADKGIAGNVDGGAWAGIAERMQAAFRGGDFAAGLDQAIDAVDALLVPRFPRHGGAPAANELPDAPVIR